MPLDAREIALKYMTPRYLRLDMSERYIHGTQYEGRSPFLATDDAAPPLLERAPCIVDKIARNAANDLVDFMMGEDRYPVVSCGSSEDDRKLDIDWGLDETQSATLERWINGPLTKAAKLHRQFPAATKMAMHAGSVAVVASIRQGLPNLEALPAKWCTPTFDPTTGDVVKLEVKYPYIIEQRDPIDPTKWEEKCKLYRRVIDAVADTVYLPADGLDTGLEPSWAVDWSQTRGHGLGYCPARWYAFERGEPTAAHFDGKALHQGLHDELDALNFSRSQNHRAALYAGDPQIWETGVDEDTAVAPAGRPARVEVEVQAGQIGPDGKPKAVGVFTSSPRSWGRRGNVRKKGPGVVWRYPEATSKVGLLSLAEGALKAISDNSEDIRKKLTEELSIVLVDPSNAKSFGALSGKAMAFMFARQVSRADSIRQDVGDNLFLTCLDLLLRMCLSVSRLQPGGLRIPGIDAVLPILQAFEQAVVAGVPASPDEPTPTTTAWYGPRMDLEWGRYFTPSAEEENFLVTMCMAAWTGGIMPLEVCLEKLREVFSFESTEELMKRLEEAKAKAQADAVKNADDTGAIGAKYAQGGTHGPPFPPKAGSGSGAKGDSKT